MRTSSTSMDEEEVGKVRAVKIARQTLQNSNGP